MKDRLLLVLLSVSLILKSTYSQENPLPGAIETAEIYFQTEKGVFLQEDRESGAGNQAACLESLAICIEQEAQAYTEGTAFTDDGIKYLLNNATHNSSLDNLFFRLLSEIGRHRNYPMPGTAFKWVKVILETVVSCKISGYNSLLMEIYTNGYDTDDTLRLNQIKQICGILHPLFQAGNSTADNAFENSRVYRRILRREIYLTGRDN